MNTFQDQEYEEETGWVKFKWRNHDPAIGRFFNIDPLAEDYVYNSPYAFSENAVIAHIELEGLEKVPFRVATERNLNPKKSEVYSSKIDLQTSKLDDYSFDNDSDLTYSSIGLWGSQGVSDPEIERDGDVTTLTGSMEWVNGADYEISMSSTYESSDGEGNKYGTIDVTASIEGVKSGKYDRNGAESGVIKLGSIEILNVNGEDADSGSVNTTVYFSEDKDGRVSIISADHYNLIQQNLEREKQKEQGNEN